MFKKYERLDCQPNDRITSNFNVYATPVIEEDLFYIAPKEESCHHRRFVVEIKMKGCGTFFPESPSQEFIATFLEQYEERERLQILELINKARTKIHSSESNFYFLRDVAKISDQNKPKPIRLFDCDSFYKNQADGRRSFIRDQLSQAHSYLRCFDGQGKRIKSDEMEKVFGSWLGDEWIDGLATLVSECLDEQLIRLMAKLQTLTGSCLADHLLRLRVLGYPSIRDSKGVGFLLRNFDRTVEIIMAELELSATLSDFNSDFDIVSKIRQKLSVEKNSLAEPMESANQTSSQNTGDCEERKGNDDELELSIYYTIILLIITFSDCSNILDLRLMETGRENSEIEEHFHEKEVKVADRMIGVKYRNTMIDFRLKKDGNLVGKFNTMKNLRSYSQFINSKYIS
jgi:hypothetical protein